HRVQPGWWASAGSSAASAVAASSVVDHRARGRTLARRSGVGKQVAASFGPVAGAASADGEVLVTARGCVPNLGDAVHAPGRVSRPQPLQQPNTAVAWALGDDLDPAVAEVPGVAGHPA